MRVISIDKHKKDVIEVRWMWLPTFIGQNSHLLQMLDKDLMKEFPPPFEATKEKLDEIHNFVINWLTEKLPIEGLPIYLQGIADVIEGEGESSNRRPVRLPDEFIKLLGDRRREELKDERVIHEMRNLATDSIEWFFIPEGD